MANEEQKVTIYAQTEFGFLARWEARLHDHGRMQWAQYENAPYAIFKAKRKRSYVRVVKGYEPYMLIVEGWGNPDVEAANWDVEIQDDGTEIKRSRGTVFSGQNIEAFEKMINAKIESGEVKVIADYRDRRG